jgi:hypothetical protein
MEKVEQLTAYLDKLLVDGRITPIHIALSTALCYLWIVNQFNNPYRVSRRVLMKASRIRSKATYHKVISDLSALGYITYKPSYHPKKGSTITMNF